MARSTSNRPRAAKKQSASGGLFRLGTKRPKARKQQVKRYYIALTRRRKLVVSLRRFRTRKSQRSKRYKQLVFKVYFLPVKEVAIAPVRWRRPQKRDSRGRFTKSSRVYWRRIQAVASVILILAGIGGAIYFGLDLRKPSVLEPIITKIPARTVQAVTPTSHSLPRSEPVHLRIDRVDIDTDVLTVGRNADGTIEVPADYHEAGWYKYSPTPGELGPSIIVGHVDNVHGIAVFWRLRELIPGDIIEITRADGTMIHFRVLLVTNFPRDNFPTQEVYGNIVYAGIRLITCGGVFNRSTHEYSHNTVVYGALVD